QLGDVGRSTFLARVHRRAFAAGDDSAAPRSGHRLGHCRFPLILGRSGVARCAPGARQPAKAPPRGRLRPADAVGPNRMWRIWRTGSIARCDSGSPLPLPAVGRGPGARRGGADFAPRVVFLPAMTVSGRRAARTRRAATDRSCATRSMAEPTPPPSSPTEPEGGAEDEASGAGPRASDREHERAERELRRAQRRVWELERELERAWWALREAEARVRRVRRQGSGRRGPSASGP